MINNQMRHYDYYAYGENNAYGQPQLSEKPQGTVKMAINVLSQNLQDNILYKNCSYIGLTYDNKVNDTYVIEYENERLKVSYTNTIGRLTQVFLSRM